MNLVVGLFDFVGKQSKVWIFWIRICSLVVVHHLAALTGEQDGDITDGCDEQNDTMFDYLDSVSQFGVSGKDW